MDVYYVKQVQNLYIINQPFLFPIIFNLNTPPYLIKSVGVSQINGKRKNDLNPNINDSFILYNKDF